jgi:hypothetical protein
MITNYTTLIQQVANYLGRSDLTSQIPLFVQLAQRRLDRDIRIRQMLRTSTASMTAGDPTVGLPFDFLATRDLFVDTNPRQPLRYLTSSAFTTTASTNTSGVPIYYTVRSTEFEFAPVPDSAYTLQMTYYAKPPLLNNNQQSNVYITSCPDAILYASLLEAEPYLMNDTRAETWARLYQNAVDALNKSDDESEYSGVPLIMKLV